MKKIQRRMPDLRAKENRYLWYILILPAFLICFFSLELFGPEEYWVSHIPLDDKLPFCEYFVIPYVLWFPFLFGVGFMLLFLDHEGFKKYMSFIGISFGIAVLICAVFPNGQELRPAELPRDNLCSRVVALLYTIDDNQNVLPSTHVLGAIAATLACWLSPAQKSRAVKVGSIILTLLIIAATMLIKQHSALDVIVALPVAVVVFLIVYRPWKRKNVKNDD